MLSRSFATFVVFALAAATAPHASAGKLHNSPIIDLPGGEYSPSVMHDALDNKTRIWWCAENPVGLNEVISYQEIGANGSRTAPQIVLKANSTISGAPALAWEGNRVCDPTVVRGSWVYGGTTYTFAMYYTTEKPSLTLVDSNRIGLAFSNDGINWTKYAAAAVVDDGVSTPFYGTGAAVAWRAGSTAGHVRMVYLDVDINGNTRHWYREALDGINFGGPTARTQVSHNGLSVNGVAGISPWHPAIGIAPGIYQNGYYYYMAAVCETYGAEYGYAAKGVCVYRTAGDYGLFNGPWEKVLDPAHSRPFENQPGIHTDQWGAIATLPRISVSTGCSDDPYPGFWGMCVTDGTQ